jgi:hypothetical protein
MMTTLRAAIVFAVFLIVVPEGAQAGTSGNDWNKFPEGQKWGYILGVIDSWVENSSMRELVSRTGTSGTLDGLSMREAELSRCLDARSMPLSQVVAIVKKYMQDNPANWHFSMTGEVMLAMSDACKSVIK